MIVFPLWVSFSPFVSSRTHIHITHTCTDIRTHTYSHLHAHSFAQAVRNIDKGFTDVTLRFSGSADGNLLSRMASKIEQTLLLPKKQQYAAGVTNPDAPTLVYKLASTTSNSATFQFDLALKNVMDFEWNIGRIDIEGRYRGQLIATGYVENFYLKRGANTFRAFATLSGQGSSLSGDCISWNGVISNPGFCYINEVISKIISQVRLFPAKNLFHPTSRLHFFPSFAAIRTHVHFQPRHTYSHKHNHTHTNSDACTHTYTHALHAYIHPCVFYFPRPTPTACR